ncbi:hypothetical protein ANN_08672 [Periplaneta americana]|uniref:Uncharacterized protein n=1 Tax=Periplaneta americana TaxID=6978 RepID=A0ABQ8T233_PERAM|nr:hypothetical protein ANN_08672 [Periplaneta americana]
MEQLMAFGAFLIVGSERLFALVITSKVLNVLMCLQIIVLNIITVYNIFAVASRSKASRLGLALRNARWFESS